VSNYKPKVSGIEIGIIKSKDESKIGMMNAVTKKQQEAVHSKQQRIEMKEKCEKEVARQHRILEQTQIEMAQQQKENEEKLKAGTTHVVSRLSKKRKAKLDKIDHDDTLSPAEKEALRA